VKVVKNKVAPPFQEAEFDILYGSGISRAGEVLDLGVAAGFVEKSGSHFLLAGERMGQGRERAVEWLKAHAAEMETVAARIVSATASPAATREPAAGAEAA